MPTDVLLDCSGMISMVLPELLISADMPHTAKNPEHEGNHGNHALQPLFGSKQLDEHADGDAYDGKLLQ